mgnify:CR=1 FL=1
MILKIALLIILWIIFIGDFASHNIIIGAFIGLLIISMSIRSETFKYIKFHFKK